VRLISKQHDYYDAPFRASACDPKYMFVREKSEIKIPTKIPFMEWTSIIRKKDYSFVSGIIGFCGKIYPFIKHRDYYSTDDQFFYTTDDFNKSFPEIMSGESEITGVARLLYKCSDISNWLDRGCISSGWFRMKAYSATTDKMLLDIFSKKRIAYFSVDCCYDRTKSITAEIYPLLKNYSFYKVFDTYLAFQTIEHFLTNELIRPDEINVVISDNLKAQSKGFDKWSFRKEPSIKK
jgi:hypothetical protein